MVENVVHEGGLGGGGLDVTRGARDGAGQEVGYLWEVENGGAALDGKRGDVVGSGCHFRGREGSQPDPGLLPGLPDFGDPFSPCPHSDSSVHQMLAAATVVTIGDVPASLLTIHFLTPRPGLVFSTSLGLGFRV